MKYTKGISKTFTANKVLPYFSQRETFLSKDKL